MSRHVAFAGHVRPLRHGVVADDPRRAVRRRRGADRGARSPTTTSRRRLEVPVVAVSRGPAGARPGALGARAVVGQGPRDRRPQINARAETVTTKPAYKRAFVKRRAHHPADGFYEWQKIEGQKQKQPWFIRRRDGEPLAFAGLWEIWHDPEIGDDAPRVRTLRDHHDRRQRRCSRRSTTACRSCSPSRSGTGGSTPRSTTSPRCSSCSCPRPPTSSRRGRCRRSSTRPTTTARSCSSRRSQVASGVMEHARVRRRDPRARATRSRPRRAPRASTRRCRRARSGRSPICSAHVGRIHHWVTAHRRDAAATSPTDNWRTDEPPRAGERARLVRRRVPTRSPTRSRRVAPTTRCGRGRPITRAASGRAAGARGRGAPLGRAARGRRRRSRSSASSRSTASTSSST